MLRARGLRRYRFLHHAFSGLATKSNTTIKEALSSLPMTAVFCTTELERKFSNDRHRTRVAGEHRLWIVEICIPRRQVVQVTTGNGIETSHVVYAKSRAGVTARNVLSMVEDIAELRTQTKLEPLGN